jgi:SUMO ligase MMS21 Smc5/6 complex component
MITKNDIIILLTDLQEKGLDVSTHLNNTLKNGVSISTIQFINSNRQLDLYKFYEKIRKSYNQKHSNLYINIVKEIDDINKVLITLSALETQILIFSKNVEDREMFLRHSRALEISKVLSNYFINYDSKPCIKLIQLIKADLKCLQEVS